MQGPCSLPVPVSLNMAVIRTRIIVGDKRLSVLSVNGASGFTGAYICYFSFTHVRPLPCNHSSMIKREFSFKLCHKTPLNSAYRAVTAD